MSVSQALHRLSFPIEERRFTYGRYEALLERISGTAPRVAVMPLDELRAAEAGEKLLVGLRHDVDDRLDSALVMGCLEAKRDLRSTYFVLHTARYWRGRGFLRALRTLQDDYGHEIGWHNDLVTLQCIYGVAARDFLARELEWLRASGIRMTGVAAHGSPHCYRLGYHNSYFFSDFPEQQPGFPNVHAVPTRSGLCRIEKARLAEFGFEYEAYHLGHELYFSDARFDERHRRWHPDSLLLEDLPSGKKAVALIHPCHWDRSAAHKLVRMPVHLGKVVRQRVADRRAEGRARRVS